MHALLKRVDQLRPQQKSVQIWWYVAVDKVFITQDVAFVGGERAKIPDKLEIGSMQLLWRPKTLPECAPEFLLHLEHTHAGGVSLLFWKMLTQDVRCSSVVGRVAKKL